LVIPDAAARRSGTPGAQVSAPGSCASSCPGDSPGQRDGRPSPGHSRRDIDLEPPLLTQLVEQPHPGRRDRPVLRMEDELLEEVAGQGQAGADIAGAEAGLGAEQEGRQVEQLVGVGFAGLAADGAAGAGADPDEVVDGAADGAAAEVEAEAEILQQAG